MRAQKVEEEFLQSCSIKVAKILEAQIDKMCKTAVQKLKKAMKMK